ncbi:MAG: division/cell wall cluster transcriptional repressor MraZ [Firmicutes bacterium HGW-Firmicutes-9]|nr:MAG: division/cell wall cluster transcriptional repressor MraZ [Firmicutes bacterium HGW-Firmicutes-9]
MLIGSFEHMLDAKGRVFIPAKWRESVGDTLVLTLGLLESTSAVCLSGMSLEEWERFSQKLSALPVTDVKGQAIRRKIYSMAAACEIDKQGRILIPAQLRDLAELTKDATLIGVGERVEIWNPETLTDYNAACEENYGDALAHLAALGI